jgi:ketosteroid isomerase-like protein
MKLTFLLILTSALTACATTQVQQHKAPAHRPARESIEAAYKKFEVAFHEGDADTIAQVYAADAEWFIANAPVVVKGREAIGRAWKHEIGAGGNNLKIDVVEVEESGDWAYEVGRFNISAPDGTALMAGKYIVVWKLIDGEWKTYRDLFNTDAPPR